MYPKAFEFEQGDSPLLISMPHVGQALSEEVAEKLTPKAAQLPDTDWHLPKLYADVKKYKPSLIIANYSRYVVDLNRPADNQPLYQGNTTGLFPQTLFNGEPLFHSKVSDEQHEWAKSEIWQPYYKQIESELARLKAKFGYALLFDAHSIASHIPYLFDGKLPDLNLGTNEGKSCDPLLSQALSRVCEKSDYSSVLNGRFKGGYITRYFGRPEQHIHAIQLEMCQCIYMREQHPFSYLEELAEPLQSVLNDLIEQYLYTGQVIYAQ